MIDSSLDRDREHWIIGNTGDDGVQRKHLRQFHGDFNYISINIWSLLPPKWFLLFEVYNLLLIIWEIIHSQIKVFFSKNRKSWGENDPDKKCNLIKEKCVTIHHWYTGMFFLLMMQHNTSQMKLLLWLKIIIQKFHWGILRQAIIAARGQRLDGVLLSTFLLLPYKLLII